MLEVLVFLFEQYYGSELDPSQNQWSRRLESAGFESDEIDEALDWLNDLRDVDLSLYAGLAESTGGNRCYSVPELNRLTAECRGFLMFLENTQAVTPLQREVIIDRVMSLTSESATVDAVKLVTLMVLWAQRAPLDMLLVEELLYTGRPLNIH